MLLGTPDWLNTAGAIASLVGGVISGVSLGLTYIVYRRVKLIQKSYLLQAVLPDHLKRLETQVKNLRVAIKQKDQERSRACCARVRAILAAIVAIVPKGHIDDLTNALKGIDGLLSPSDQPFFEQVGNVMVAIEKQQESRKTLSVELKWRQRDG